MSAPTSDPPDEQPTLSDGELVLRPWTFDDAEPTRHLHDAVTAYWFDVPAQTPTLDQQRAWIETTHAEWARDRSKVTFLVEHGGERWARWTCADEGRGSGCSRG